MERLKNETVSEYLVRLEAMFIEHSTNFENILKEMKEKGIKICSHCGCSMCKDKEHKCQA